MTNSTTDADIYQLAHDLRAVDGQNRVEKMREMGQYSQTGPGAGIIKELSRRLSLTTSAYKKAPTRRKGAGTSPRTKAQHVLKQVDSHVLVAITIETVLNAITSERSNRISVLRRAVGRSIHEHLRIMAHKKANPKMFATVKKWLPDVKKKGRHVFEDVLRNMRATAEFEYREILTAEEADIAGAVMLELLLQACPDVFDTVLIQDHTKQKRRQQKSYVRFTPTFAEDLKKVEEIYAEITPLNLPITEPPLNWTTTEDGGFYDNMIRRRPIMGTRYISQLKGMSRSNCAPVYQAVNNLQRTTWAVNVGVLEVLREAVTAGWWQYDGLDIPKAEAPVKPEYPGDAVKEEKGVEWKEYANACRRWAREAETWDLRRAEFGRLLYFGDFYSKRGHHHLVHGIDFRGRLYPTTSALNYQGRDVERALCQFKEAKPIGEGAAWYLVHGANAYGYDKCTFEERVAWVHQHAREIIAVHEDPIENRWWVEADKPWLFLAWCMEAGEYLQNPTPQFVSQLPISMDGSSNGIQIYSLLLRDEVGGAATNCMPVDNPADIYQLVADETTRLLVQEVEQQGENAVFADCWLKIAGGALPRKATKRVVMTEPYSSTMYARQHYVSEYYWDQVRGSAIENTPFPPKQTYRACWWLAEKISEALRNTATASSRAMAWMRDVCAVANSQGKHLEWTAPTGLLVKQHYCKSTTRQVELTGTRKVKVYLRDTTDLVDPNKSANGFCPNFVHSLDAAAATMTVNAAAAEGITDLMMIHDSFGCHASHAPRLAYILRDVYSSIFTEDLLENLRQELTLQLAPGTVLPPTPDKGSLNPADLLRSQYFFA